MQVRDGVYPGVFLQQRSRATRVARLRTLMETRVKLGVGQRSGARCRVLWRDVRGSTQPTTRPGGPCCPWAQGTPPARDRRSSSDIPMEPCPHGKNGPSSPAPAQPSPAQVPRLRYWNPPGHTRRPPVRPSTPRVDTAQRRIASLSSHTSRLHEPRVALLTSSQSIGPLAILTFAPSPCRARLDCYLQGIPTPCRERP